MKDLSPGPGPRRKAALAFWIVFTLAFLGMLIYQLFVGRRDLSWIGLSGALCLIGIWRWILVVHGSPTRPR